MSPKPKVVLVHLKDIKQVFDVRKALDQDYVLHLAMLYESGVELPPIEVTEKYEIIDGRNRHAAAELAKREVLPCIVIAGLSEVERITRAFAANVGGSKPPTTADIHHTINRLMDMGLNEKKIIDLLSLPRQVSRRYVSAVTNARSKANLERAMRDVAEGGMSVKAAADKWKVRVETLSKSILGRKDKIAAAQNVKGNLSTSYKSRSRSNNHMLTTLIQQYEDGEVSEGKVIEIIDHLEHLILRQKRQVDDLRIRFESIRNSVNRFANFKPNGKEAEAHV